MTVTHTKDLLFQILDSVHGHQKDDIKKSAYTTKGTEAIIEYGGAFYRISVEHLTGGH